jgi:NAD(P)-dependent dehydrogenase (short-subunit alcohol dehydrogenase family)
MSFRDRVCIVTGATRGLGRQIALRLWKKGASLLLVARDSAALASLCESLQRDTSTNQRVVVFACDLSLPTAATAITSKLLDEFDVVTALINNAAILGPVGPFWENDFDLWQQTIRVNLLAPAELCSLIIPVMRKEGYGKIVNLSGGGATSPRPYFSAYATAKVGLVRLTEVLAHETSTMHIDINCIAPGVMPTGMLEEIRAVGLDRAGSLEFAQLQQQSSEPEKSLDRAAELAEFLVSAESDGITGRLISAVWDPWQGLPQRRELLGKSDIYTLRRIVPQDRGLDWGAD